MLDCSSGVSITYYKACYLSVTAFVIDFIWITADRAVDYLGILMAEVSCRFKIDFKRLEAKVTSYVKKKVVKLKKFFHKKICCYFLR